MVTRQRVPCYVYNGMACWRPIVSGVAMSNMFPAAFAVLQHAGDQAHLWAVLQWPAERHHGLRGGSSAGPAGGRERGAESAGKGGGVLCVIGGNIGVGNVQVLSIKGRVASKAT